MSSYDEHLISQAGGDGDALEAIESRHRKAQEVKDRYGSIWVYQSNPAHDDRTTLLALVREQAAKLEAVRALCSDWDAVVDVFPLTPAALFAGSHAKRVREALESKP